MDPTVHLALACIAFVVLHVLPSSPLRAALVRTIGEKAYLLLFSIVSAAGIAWMVHAFRAAPVTALWPGLKFLPTLAMPVALVLLACGVLSPNPTAVAQSKLLAKPDPAHGIIRVTRHPVMWAIMLWSGAHLLARGELGATLFFGTFLLVALIGTVLQDRRKAQVHGEDWKRFAGMTSNIPFAAIVAGRNRLVWSEIGLTRIAFGLILFGGFFYLHGAWFGPRLF